MKLSHYTSEILLARYINLVQEAADYRSTNSRKMLIDNTIQGYIKELWERNGGWNG